MAQRILEPGEIEALAQRSIPQFRLPDPQVLFARRAARFRQLAVDSEIGDYLQFLAAVAGTQHAAAQHLNFNGPPQDHLDRCAEHGMPPIGPSVWPPRAGWRETLHMMGERLFAQANCPVAVADLITKLGGASPQWLNSQAHALLHGTDEAIDVVAAPFIMAALQVEWSALAAAFANGRVAPLDVPGLCPLCGTQPVAGVVRANSPYQGYRYLSCALCATEWHMVRVQCSGCGASGKSIAYQTASHVSDETNAGAQEAIRAETCEVCRGYRKMLYEEKDIDVDPIADDLATLHLDLLLGESGYHRLSGNPLLWQPDVS
jgi:FdhE protein